MLQGYKDGTAGDNITEANVANEEDGVGDGYQDGEQMSRAKGTHPGGRVRVEKDVSADTGSLQLCTNQMHSAKCFRNF